MNVNIIVLVTLLWCSAFAYNDYRCNRRSALLLQKRPAYEFSIRLLQRVTDDTDAHFVYSPLSTWLQLTALAEGTRGRTFREIWKVTKHHRNRCFKKKLGEILFYLNKDLKYESRRKSIMAIDSLMAVKKYFIKEVERLYGIKVMLLDFNESKESADEVNNAIKASTGVIDRILYYDDFVSTVLLMSDASFFRSAWRSPFNSGYNKKQPFYSSEGLKIGEVSMMTQIGYFHLIEFPHIGAKVLELPFANRRISMLVFLPTDDRHGDVNHIREIFYRLQRTRLTSIFNLYKRQGLKLVNVTLPKFKQRTEVDNLAELVYDMGIKRIFNPDLAELKGISNYKMYASLMTQVVDIEINEKGVLVGVEFLARNDTSTQFVANKPFAYIIVDKLTEFILYAGMYSNPSEF